MARTTGGGLGSVISSSFIGSDSDWVGAGSGDVASVVSTAFASFGTSASYDALRRGSRKATHELGIDHREAWVHTTALLMDSSNSSLEITTPSSSLITDSDSFDSEAA